jgi:N-acetylmuramoyl-L-alanine amidase
MPKANVLARRHSRRRPIAAVLFGLGALIVATLPGGLAAREVARPEVTAVRSWEHPTHTRFVLEISEAVEYRMFVLPDPERLVIDFPEVTFEIPRQLADRPTVGVIKGYRYGLFREGTSRVVLDLAGPAVVKRSFVLAPSEGKPHRIVLDLIPTTAAAFAEAARNARPTTTVRPEVARAPQIAPSVKAPATRARGRHVIVIDPGHGGVDPGATSYSGLYEKDIALTAARELRDRLAATGRYEVVLTRDRDMFVSLRERVRIGQERQADLFVSIHADSIAQKTLRGAHVYSLSEEASDAAAAAVAAKENKADVIAGVDLGQYPIEVGSILLDLAQRDTNNVSAELADILIKEFRGSGVHLLRKPHRQAGFAVLKAPDVPSVLIELGFLSNPRDEAMLRDPAARATLLAAVARALDSHFARRTARRF